MLFILADHFSLSVLFFSADHVPPCAAGLVFFAFGLNMVDCGGLLGGRLGANAPPKQSKKTVEPALGTPTIGRTFTL